MYEHCWELEITSYSQIPDLWSSHSSRQSYSSVLAILLQTMHYGIYKI